MSFNNPAHVIPRRSVVGMENEWAKMFDPPVASPPTPDLVLPTNPVPEVMLAQGLLSKVSTPHTVELSLMKGITLDTWDTRAGGLKFFVFFDPDNPSFTGSYPSTTLRVPRGVIFHSHTKGQGPPPHTIHWHGIEPSPINDGVGHCSTELGEFTYQWQPNQMGTYFYHCHRNTMQHFEFGIFGGLIVMAPDAYFASIASTNPDGTVTLNSVPVGACADGRFRVQANTALFPEFPGFVLKPLESGDPHAYTVPYDVEALWVPDDRDSRWSDLADNPRATFPSFGTIPGVNDRFDQNSGTDGFFAFNDFSPDYFYVTGVPVPAPRGGKAAINPPASIPPALNGGIAGSQVGVNAQVGQTILLRVIDACFIQTRITLPVDALIIAFDGRALGVPPLSRYNRPFMLHAGNSITLNSAMRFDALIRPTRSQNNPAKIEYLDTRGGTLLMTAEVPFVISS